MSIQHDIDETVYHRMGGLSSTGAKTILRCPAQFDHDRKNPPRKKVWDFGSVAHRLILGKGSDFAVVDGNRNAKDVKAQIAEHEAAGRIVIKSEQLAAAEAMAGSVDRSPDASALLARGEAEVSIFSDVDEVPLRGRVDWLTHKRDGTPVVVDVKTSSANLHSDKDLARSIENFGYHVQAAHYLRILAANDMQAEWLWLFVSSSAPHCARVVGLTQEWLEAGHESVERAIGTYKECTERNEFACRCDQFTILDRPGWAKE